MVHSRLPLINLGHPAGRMGRARMQDEESRPHSFSLTSPAPATPFSIQEVDGILPVADMGSADMS